MKISNLARTLAMASMLALAVVSVPAVQVEAAGRTKAQCKAAGYQWDPTRHACADTDCEDAGGLLHAPGTTIVIGKNIYMCDGTTGHWEMMRTQTTPTGPEAPLPVGNAPTTAPTPSDPIAPLPIYVAPGS